MATRSYNGSNNRSDVFENVGKMRPEPTQGGSAMNWHRDQTKVLGPREDVVTYQERAARKRIANGGTGNWMINEVKVGVVG